MSKINKIKNFEGRYFHCSNCGREIKHAFTIEGVQGQFGSECIYQIAGVTAKNQIKRLNDLSKRWHDISNHPKVYSLDSYIEVYGSIDKVEEIFFKYGRLQ